MSYMENFTVETELMFGKELITPNTMIKFKNQQGEYLFKRVVTNPAINKTWIDCIDAMRRSWSSFYVEDLRGVVKPKKRRKK